MKIFLAYINILYSKNIGVSINMEIQKEDGKL